MLSSCDLTLRVLANASQVGHAHLIPGLVAPNVTTRVVTVSLRPLVVEVENFLTEG